MFERTQPRTDAFTFSLNGLRAIAPFTVASAIAHDRINKAIDERLRQPQEDQPDSAREIGTAWGRFWLRARRRAA